MVTPFACHWETPLQEISDSFTNPSTIWFTVVITAVVLIVARSSYARSVAVIFLALSILAEISTSVVLWLDGLSTLGCCR